MFGEMTLHPKTETKKHYRPLMFEEINISFPLFILVMKYSKFL